MGASILVLFNPRKFLTKTDKPKNTLGKFLTDEEKLAFLKTSVSWISSKDIMDTCFILNYGYEAPLPWPQVNISCGIIKKSLKYKRLCPSINKSYPVLAPNNSSAVNI